MRVPEIIPEIIPNISDLSNVSSGFRTEIGRTLDRVRHHDGTRVAMSCGVIPCEVAAEVTEELLELLEHGSHPEDRFGAAVQLIGMGLGEKTIDALGRLIETPVGEHRTRAAAQLGRIGEPAMAAFASRVRGAVNKDDDGLALTAIESLNAIDPENMVGSPQIVRLLRRRVLRMWRCGAFVRATVDETMMLRLIRALAIVGRCSDDALHELQYLENTTEGRVQSMVREALRAFEAAHQAECSVTTE